tara:strand:+ start:3579 stop:4505 length:927 start_codon:yes stop_codon:yes gene_type:complete
MINVVGPTEAEWLLTLAELPELESMDPLDGGWDNTNFLLRLKDGSEVVMKAWFANDVEEVRRVVQRHIHLDSNGIPTTVPLQLSNGERLAERGGSAWTILPFVSGGMLGCDENSLRSLGGVLSRMSSIPHADCFPRDFRMGFSLFDEVIDWQTSHGKVSFVDLLSSEASEIKIGIPENLPMGVLHGDLFPDNVIGCDGDVMAILDLEEAWIGPRVFDLVMAFVGFGWNGGEPSERRWRALVDGYQKVSRISSEEIEALPILYRYATLSIACWRFWKHNISVPDDLLSGRYLEMVDRLSLEVDLKSAFE